MKIAIASGKGGTGKTTVSTNLALSLSESIPVSLLDCDVEEPNCHIFLGATPEETKDVNILSPKIDNSLCIKCGECAKACRFNALVAIKDSIPMIFPELCHSCGGCALACKPGAITEVERKTGIIELSRLDNLSFVSGLMNVGEAMAIPVIHAVKKCAVADGVNILDCPPGTACAMVASVQDADFAILVTEPTPFGLHDLTLAVDTVRELGVSFGVVLNRAGAGDMRVDEYCEREQVPMLLRIDDDRRVAEAYSRGIPAVKAIPELKQQFLDLYNNIRSRVEK